MTHKYHVEDSHVGCLPENIATFRTKREATDFLRHEVDERREQGFRLTGNLRTAYFSDGSAARIFIARCDDPRCEWEDDA